MGLYQTVRPKKLDDVIGNRPAKIAFKQSLDREPVSRNHVFLLTGPSGCGKTTLARIMATEFGALETNIIEKNAASKDSRGIDMATDLGKLARLSPLGGGSRVVILDEAHQLTAAAQVALLKTLEDVPSFMYYFLCTTDPRKLLKTIHTRCDEIGVRKLTSDELDDVLANAIESQKLDIPTDNVLDKIISRAEGCPREALVMLEKVTSLSEDDALSLLKSYTKDNKEVIDICRALLKGEPWKIIAHLFKSLPKEIEPEALRRGVLGYLNSCLLGAAKPSQADVFADMMEELMEHAYVDGKEKVLLCLYRARQIAVKK